MKQSNYLQIIYNDSVNAAICYHSLFGAGDLQFLFDKKYIDTLELFSRPRDIDERDNLQVVNDLIDAGFIVEDDVTPSMEREEYREKTAKWMSQVKNGELLDYLNLSISEACNFGCPHCSQACIPASEDITKKVMNWDVAKNALDYYFHIIKANGGKANIHFGSEEPLLNKNVFIKSVNYIKQMHPDAELSINTNLSLLTEEIADFIVMNEIDVITSLDGLRKTNGCNSHTDPQNAGAIDTTPPLRCHTFPIGR